MAIPGSLRKNSINHGLLRAALDDVPDGISLEIAEIRDIPIYDFDVQQGEGIPASVGALHEKIKNADAVLIATPEYNYSIPGGLKNAIDWLSRVPDQAFNGKAIGIIGAAAGRAGTARSQYHLRQVFVFLNGHVMNKPELMVSEAMKIAGEDGSITDAETRRRIGDSVAALADWARKIG